MTRRISLYRDSEPGDPPLDTALTRVLLGRIATSGGEGLRVHTPGNVVAFSPLDATQPGYARAVAAAGEAGFGAIRRLAGGRAAVFHESTLAFAWCVASEEPRIGIRERFETLSEAVARALRGLGVDARVGEVPGEYCPGDHSVNAAGRRKIMGVGQRLVRGAAHVGGVIVLGGADRIRDVLGPVYAELGIDWDPTATGSLEDEIGPVSAERVAQALIDELCGDATIELTRFGPDDRAEAEALAKSHRA